MEDKEIIPNNFSDGRKLTGLFLLACGGLVLASKMGAPIPGWLLSWEFFLIALGVFIGIKHNFKNPAWFILIIIGTFSLSDNFAPDYDLQRYAWPVAIMLLGVFFIFKPKSGFKSGRFTKRFNSGYTNLTEPATNDGVDTVDISAVFGGVKRRLISKNFKGGDITAFMGGAEIDMSQSDIQGTVVLDISAVFGGAKLIVPSNWNVISKATAIFGGVDDKRQTGFMADANKTLVIDGVAIFGGIEIKSY